MHSYAHNNKCRLSPYYFRLCNDQIWMRWLWSSLCWRWLAAGWIWEWGLTQRNKDGCSGICHPFLAAHRFLGTFTPASSFNCWSLALRSPLGETGHASIQVSLLSGGAGKISLPSLQYSKECLENEREGWVRQRLSMKRGGGVRSWPLSGMTLSGELAEAASTGLGQLAHLKRVV